MKKSFIVAAFAAVAACGIAGLSNAGEPKKDPPSTQKSEAINKFCAVMQEHEADPKVIYEYKEKKVAFCCPDCIDEFKKDPEKYMKTIK